MAEAMRKMTEYLGFNTAQEYDDDWDEDLGDQPEEIQLRIGSLRPRNYNEAITIGEHFREGSPVIMDLTDMADEDAKRLVDFAAGLTFGTRGGIQRITGKLFLLTPPGVTVIDHR